MDRKVAPVPLQGSPEPLEALPLSVNWMKHGLKEDAEPESPTNGFLVEDGGPKVSVQDARCSFCICSCLQ